MTIWVGLEGVNCLEGGAGVWQDWSVPAKRRHHALLPSRFAAVILTFTPVFVQQRTWRHAEVLLIGAILAHGQCTLTSLLRIMGLSQERRFVNYHRLLNRAGWSSRASSRLLLGLLLDTFAPAGPVMLGIDDTIERRRGKRITAKGIYRDPARSSHGHFVEANGLRWLSLMLLAPIPWQGGYGRCRS